VHAFATFGNTQWVHSRFEPKWVHSLTETMSRRWHRPLTKNQKSICRSLRKSAPGNCPGIVSSQEKLRRIVHRPDGGITLEQKQIGKSEGGLLFFIVRGLAQNALEVMLTMQSFNRLNRRLMRIGSSVEVLGDAGKDAQRHRLVSIACSRCGVGTEWRPVGK